MKNRIAQVLICITLISAFVFALSSCDLFKKEEPKHEHTYGEWGGNTATCTTPGEEKRVCTDETCGHTETRPTEALGHKFENGVCTVCSEKAPHTEHTFGEWGGNTATCTAPGEEKRVCTYAGCTEEETRPTEALGHNFVDGVCTRCEATEPKPEHTHTFGEWEVDVAATCTTAGTNKRVCTADDCDYFETTPVAALGHDFVDGDCSRCDATEPAPHEHSFGEWNVEIAATCEAKGLKKRTCTAEGCGYFETEEIAALGHDMVAKEAKPVTCTEEGWEAYEACSRCDKNTKVVIAAPGHNYVKGNCSVCGTEHEHTYGDWYGDTSTCTEAGKEYRDCTGGCGKVDERATAAGHDYKDGFCTVCGHKRPDDYSLPVQPFGKED